ncbi:MAG: N-6 DNA methylase [Candidatus Paceibacterota bacterium]|jgi:type I restriction enzyme M protein
MKIQMENNKIFSPLRNKWLSYTPEEEVRQNYICTLVNDYGYSLEQMDEELQVNNSQRGQGKSRADIVIWKSKEEKLSKTNAFIVVECKSDNVVIHPEDYYQGNNYASWARAKFFITHNNAETKYFQMLENKLPVDLNEIVNIPKASDVNDEEKLKELAEETKVFTRDEFSKLLFKCHNIIRNNDKLSPEGAFDEISKILFIKIRYERQQGKKVFSISRFNELKKGYDETASKNSKPFYQVLFEKTKEDFEKDELFEANEEIKIRENSFEQIVKELERYNLSDTGDDVKGIAFEQFLGKTFRGELGQFFTPRTIVDFMIDIVDPKEGDLICDPCCGSGGFLIKAFDYVREKIEDDILNKKEEIKKKYFDEKYQKSNDTEKEKIDAVVETEFKKLNKELDNQTEGSRLYDLSHKCIYGSDANPRMARTSKMNMIMHGDGHGGVHHNDGLLDVGGIFENRFDIVLTNPPFGSRVNKDQKITENDNKYAGKESYIQKRFGEEGLEAIRNLERNIGKNLIDTYETGNFSTLTEVLFMERYLRILKKGGKMAVVLPEGFLNNPNLQKVREYFEGRAKIDLIVSIPQDVFIASGATVKPSLVFLQKFTDAESKKYEKIKEEANNSIRAKYQKELEKLEKEVKDLKGEVKKTKKKELNTLNSTIDNEIKQEIKTKFDYQIPIAEVEKAGITTTGEKCENELIDVVKEYRKYKKTK